MPFEPLFSCAGLLAMSGWLALLASKLIPVWSDRLAGLVLPLVLSAGYIAIALTAPPPQGGFGSFAEVQTLFAQPEALLAGWVHFLAFDLVVGAWICRRGRAEGIPFWLVLPCLPLTFLFGPAGFALFALIRGGRRAVA